MYGGGADRDVGIERTADARQDLAFKKRRTGHHEIQHYDQQNQHPEYPSEHPQPKAAFAWPGRWRRCSYISHKFFRDTPPPAEWPNQQGGSRGNIMNFSAV